MQPRSPHESLDVLLHKVTLNGDNTIHIVSLPIEVPKPGESLWDQLHDKDRHHSVETDIKLDDGTYALIERLKQGFTDKQQSAVCLSIQPGVHHGYLENVSLNARSKTVTQDIEIAYGKPLTGFMYRHKNPYEDRYIASTPETIGTLADVALARQRMDNAGCAKLPRFAQRWAAKLDSAIDNNRDGNERQ